MWSYLNSGQRHRAYTRIHLAMNLPGVTLVEIVLKIREMRRLYVNELRNLLEAKSNDYCYQVQIPWFYELHQFLYPYLDYDEAVELHVRIDQLVIHAISVADLGKHVHNKRYVGSLLSRYTEGGGGEGSTSLYLLL